MGGNTKNRKISNNMDTSDSDLVTCCRNFKIAAGAKLEAMDYLGTWYPSRIIKVRSEKKEVLIHFDGWNARFDVWLPYDSERLRGVKSVKPPVQIWRVGSRVVAKWGPANKIYPAIVSRIVSDNFVEVTFYDGFKKTLKSSSLQADTEKLYRRFGGSSIKDVLNSVTPSPTNKSPSTDNVEHKSTMKSLKMKRRLTEPPGRADLVTDILKRRTSLRATLHHEEKGLLNMVPSPSPPLNSDIPTDSRIISDSNKGVKNEHSKSIPDLPYSTKEDTSCNIKCSTSTAPLERMKSEPLTDNTNINTFKSSRTKSTSNVEIIKSNFQSYVMFPIMSPDMTDENSNSSTNSSNHEFNFNTPTFIPDDTLKSNTISVSTHSTDTNNCVVTKTSSISSTPVGKIHIDKRSLRARKTVPEAKNADESLNQKKDKRNEEDTSEKPLEILERSQRRKSERIETKDSTNCPEKGSGRKIDKIDKIPMKVKTSNRKVMDESEDDKPLKFLQNINQEDNRPLVSLKLTKIEAVEHARKSLGETDVERDKNLSSSSNVSTRRHSSRVKTSKDIDNEVGTDSRLFNEKEKNTSAHHPLFGKDFDDVRLSDSDANLLDSKSLRNRNVKLKSPEVLKDSSKVLNASLKENSSPILCITKDKKIKHCSTPSTSVEKEDSLKSASNESKDTKNKVPVDFDSRSSSNCRDSNETIGSCAKRRSSRFENSAKSDIKSEKEQLNKEVFSSSDVLRRSSPKTPVGILQQTNTCVKTNSKVKHSPKTESSSDDGRNSVNDKNTNKDSPMTRSGKIRTIKPVVLEKEKELPIKLNEEKSSSLKHQIELVDKKSFNKVQISPEIKKHETEKPIKRSSRGKHSPDNSQDSKCHAGTEKSKMVANTGIQKTEKVRIKEDVYSRVRINQSENVQSLTNVDLVRKSTEIVSPKNCKSGIKSQKSSDMNGYGHRCIMSGKYEDKTITVPVRRSSRTRKVSEGSEDSELQVKKKKYSPDISNKYTNKRIPAEHNEQKEEHDASINTQFRRSSRNLKTEDKCDKCAPQSKETKKIDKTFTSYDKKIDKIRRSNEDSKIIRQKDENIGNGTLGYKLKSRTTVNDDKNKMQIKNGASTVNTEALSNQSTGDGDTDKNEKILKSKNEKKKILSSPDSEFIRTRRDNTVVITLKPQVTDSNKRKLFQPTKDNTPPQKEDLIEFLENNKHCDIMDVCNNISLDMKDPSESKSTEKLNGMIENGIISKHINDQKIQTISESKYNNEDEPLVATKSDISKEDPNINNSKCIDEDLASSQSETSSPIHKSSDDEIHVNQQTVISEKVIKDKAAINEFKVDVDCTKVGRKSNEEKSKKTSTQGSDAKMKKDALQISQMVGECAADNKLPPKTSHQIVSTERNTISNSSNKTTSSTVNIFQPVVPDLNSGRPSRRIHKKPARYSNEGDDDTHAKTKKESKENAEAKTNTNVEKFPSLSVNRTRRDSRERKVKSPTSKKIEIGATSTRSENKDRKSHENQENNQLVKEKSQREKKNLKEDSCPKQEESVPEKMVSLRTRRDSKEKMDISGSRKGEDKVPKKFEEKYEIFKKRWKEEKERRRMLQQQEAILIAENTSEKVVGRDNKVHQEEKTKNAFAQESDTKNNKDGLQISNTAVECGADKKPFPDIDSQILLSENNSIIDVVSIDGRETPNISIHIDGGHNSSSNKTMKEDVDIEKRESNSISATEDNRVETETETSQTCTKPEDTIITKTKRKMGNKGGRSKKKKKIDDGHYIPDPKDLTKLVRDTSRTPSDTISFASMIEDERPSQRKREKKKPSPLRKGKSPLKHHPISPQKLFPNFIVPNFNPRPLFTLSPPSAAQIAASRIQRRAHHQKQLAMLMNSSPEHLQYKPNVELNNQTHQNSSELNLIEEKEKEVMKENISHGESSDENIVVVQSSEDAGKDGGEIDIMDIKLVKAVKVDVGGKTPLVKKRKSLDFITARLKYKQKVEKQRTNIVGGRTDDSSSRVQIIQPTTTCIKPNERISLSYPNAFIPPPHDIHSMRHPPPNFIHSAMPIRTIVNGPQPNGPMYFNMALPPRGMNFPMGNVISRVNPHLLPPLPPPPPRHMINAPMEFTNLNNYRPGMMPPAMDHNQIAHLQFENWRQSAQAAYANAAVGVPYHHHNVDHPHIGGGKQNPTYPHITPEDVELVKGLHSGILPPVETKQIQEKVVGQHDEIKHDDHSPSTEAKGTKNVESSFSSIDSKVVNKPNEQVEDAESSKKKNKKRKILPEKEPMYAFRKEKRISRSPKELVSDGKKSKIEPKKASPASLKDVVPVDVPSTEYKCSIADCAKTFRKPQLLEYHVKYFHTAKPFVKRSRTSSSQSSTESGPVSIIKPSLKVTTPAHQAENGVKVSNASTEVDVTVQSDVTISDSESESEDEVRRVDDCVKCVCEDECELGFMIQCEQCFTWQHGECVGYSQQKTVPLFYLCHICSNPKGLRKSRQYDNDYTWYRHGRLPPVREDGCNQKPDEDGGENGEIFSSIVLTTHAMMTDLYNIRDVLQGIRNKLVMIKDPHKPKLMNLEEENSTAEKTKKYGESEETHIESEVYVVLASLVQMVCYYDALSLDKTENGDASTTEESFNVVVGCSSKVNSQDNLIARSDTSDPIPTLAGPSSLAGLSSSSLQVLSGQTDVSREEMNIIKDVDLIPTSKTILEKSSGTYEGIEDGQIDMDVQDTMDYLIQTVCDCNDKREGKLEETITEDKDNGLFENHYNAVGNKCNKDNATLNIDDTQYPCKDVINCIQDVVANICDKEEIEVVRSDEIVDIPKGTYKGLIISQHKNEMNVTNSEPSTCCNSNVENKCNIIDIGTNQKIKTNLNVDQQTNNSIGSGLDNLGKHDESFCDDEFIDVANISEDSIPYMETDDEFYPLKENVSLEESKNSKKDSNFFSPLTCHGLSNLLKDGDEDWNSCSRESLIARYNVLVEIERVEDQVNERLQDMHSKLDELESDYECISKSKAILEYFRQNFELPDMKSLMAQLNIVKWQSILKSNMESRTESNDML